MIDPSIISQGALQSQLQQQQNFESLGNLGSNLGRIIYGRRINQMQQLKTPEEQKDFANNSIFAPYLNAQLKTDNALKQKQVYDQLKTEAEIAKTSSEASKNNAQAGGFNLDNSQKKFGAIQGVFQSAAMTGDKGQVLLGLDALKRTGAITPEDYAHQFQIVKAMKTDEFGRSDELKQYASGIGLGNKEVAPYLYQSKNNEADNAQSDKNSQRTYDASIHSTDVGADTADKNRAQQGEQFQKNFEYQAQQDDVKNGEAKIQEFGGKAWIVYKNGQYKAAVDDSGKQIVSSKGGETQIQKVDRIEKALGYEDAAKSAANASTLAAKLANDLQGLNSTAGGYGIAAKIPGSPQKKFASQIETLQSQVFLNQIAKMRGLGALTDAEGQRLATSIANLDINLDPTTLQSNLSEIAKIMSGAAVKSSKLAKLHANPNGVQQSQSQQNVGSSQSMTTSMTEVRQAAQQMGMSVQDAVNMFKAQGVNIQ